MKNAIGALIALAWAGAAGAADAPARLAESFSGRVTFEDPALAAAGVEVRLTDEDGAVISRATTDGDGEYALSAAPGAYVLYVGGRFEVPVTLVAQGGAARLDALLPEEMTAAGGAVRAEWLAVGGGLLLFAVPVGVLVAVSGNGLSVSP